MRDQAICIMGDVEGDWKTMMEIINEDQPDMVLQVGDFGYWPDRPEYKYSRQIRKNKVPIYFCDGNHEDHKNLGKLCKQRGSPGPIAVGPNIFYMPRGSVLNLPDGRKVLFMGGAESVDKRQRTPGYDWFKQELILPEDLANLPDEDTKVDIVISHTCPLEFQIVPDIYADIFASDPCRAMLSQVLHKFQPELWYFGHFHHLNGGTYKNCAWSCRPRIGDGPVAYLPRIKK